jgi:hypothetical protein
MAKKAKHNNTICEAQGLTFHSQGERSYYFILKSREEKGEISELVLQPRFLLQEGFRKNGSTVRKIEYVADFQYRECDGTFKLVDVKNPGTITSTFELKKKILEYKYPDIELLLVHSLTFEEMTLKEMKASERQRKKEVKERKAKRKK